MGRTAWTMPTTIAAALLLAVPVGTETGATVSEATYAGYTRLTLAPGTDLTAAASGLMQSATTWSWPACTGGGGNTILAVAILDSSTVGAGNLLRWGTTTIIVNTGVIPQITASNAIFGES